jgi:hypothetical protein
MLLNAKGSHAREIKVFEKGDTAIVYLGMTHLAKPQFFKEVKAQVDSLRKEGYVIMREGVRFEESTDSLQRIVLRKKLRQLMGLAIGDYSDANNKSLPKFFSNGNYVMQKDSLIGLKEEDLVIDMSYSQMIAAHEDKHGEIVLTECDLKTDLNEKYPCKDGNAYNQSFYVVDKVRTEFLLEAVLQSQAKKIAVVYGAGHFKWFYPDMIKEGYEYKNKKLSFW